MAENTPDVVEEEVVIRAEEVVVAPTPVVAQPTGAPARRARTDRGGRGDRRGGGNRRSGPSRERSEFAQKLIGIRRVARVMAGGRRFNFSVAIVLGDKMGRVGVGLGKAADTQLAIEKATRMAKRGMLTIPLTKSRSISHNVHAKYCASVVEIRPAPGRGLVAGSSVRTVLELAGITDVTGKLLSRSKNPLNNARAAMDALKQMKNVNLKN